MGSFETVILSCISILRADILHENFDQFSYFKIIFFMILEWEAAEIPKGQNQDSFFTFNKERVFFHFFIIFKVNAGIGNKLVKKSMSKENID